jgi:hypothetical protein
MRRAWTEGAFAILLIGCGPSYGGQDVKTSDEWLAEQEQIAAEQEKNKQDTGDYGELETDEEKRKQFDKKQAKMELQRATRSAESCPGVVGPQETPETKQRGSATVSITFQEDGTVKDATINSPFNDTPIGECVLNAYKPVLVPPYTGGDQIVDWDVKLEDAKEEKSAKKK